MPIRIDLLPACGQLEFRLAVHWAACQRESSGCVLAVLTTPGQSCRRMKMQSRRETGWLAREVLE
jgi:hypothetical protein